MRHPMYTFRTLDAQAAIGAAPGSPTDLYAGAHLGLRVPRGRVPVGLRGGSAASTRRRRPRRRHEIASPRGRRPSPSRTAVRLRPRSTASTTLALDLDELDDIDRSSPAAAPQRPELLAFRDDDHLDPPADDLRSAFLTTSAPRAIDPAGWQVTLVTNLRVLGYVFNPASFYLVPRRGRGPPDRRGRGPQHAWRTAPLHAPTARTGPSGSSRRWTRSSTSRPSSRRAAGTRSGSATMRHACASRSTSDMPDGLVLHASLDLDAATLDRPDAARMLARHPLVTHKTIAMIHWHALRLWLRGARSTAIARSPSKPEVAR